MRAKRVQGGVAFIELQDESAGAAATGAAAAGAVAAGAVADGAVADGAETIQLMITKKEVGKEAFTEAKAWVDTGDVVGVRGVMKRTRKGQLTVLAHEWNKLTKSLLPPPTQHFGLKDPNTRLRRRALDIMVNTTLYALRRRVYIFMSFIFSVLLAPHMCTEISDLECFTVLTILVYASFSSSSVH